MDLTCKGCGEPVEFRYIESTTFRTLVHANTVDPHDHEPWTPVGLERGTYSRRPRKGDVLSTGRYGYVTVLAVHDNGVRLDVATRVHGRQTITRADAGVWWRVAKAGQS